MTTVLFVTFWTVMVFASIAWYTVLLFYVGAKGAKEIREMTRALQSRNGATGTDESSRRS